MLKLNNMSMLKQLIIFSTLMFVMGNAALAGSFVVSTGPGFSDGTVVAPVGGNPGTTIGTQRYNVFAQAASIWSGILQPSVDMTIYAEFSTELFCDADQAIFAGTSMPTVYRDFGAPYANTWYPHSLRNNILGSSSGNVISSTFNGNIAGNVGCLAGAQWYYGYDHNPGLNQIDLLNVMLHEMSHGLGFFTLVDLTTGAKSGGYDDIYMRFLRDNSINKNWPAMTNAERVTSAIDAGDLVWSGSNVLQILSVLSGGLTNNYPRLYAPNPLVVGSSVSHWNTNVTYTGGKNELMEYTPKLPFDMAITVALMRDLGWSNATYDFDKDGVGDEIDDYPAKNAAGSDTDNDGKPDSWLSGSGCSGNTCSGLTLDWDDDNDGVPDTVDAAPLDAGNTMENNLPLDSTYKGIRHSTSIQ